MSDRHRSRGNGLECSAERLPSIVLSTDDVPPEGRLETWRDYTRGVHDILLPAGAERAFEVRSEFWRLGPVTFVAHRTSRRRIVRTALERARDDLDQWFLLVSRNGPVVGSCGAQFSNLEAGRLLVGTFAETYVQDFPDGEWVTAVLTRDDLADWGLDLSCVSSPTPAGAGADLLADMLLSLGRRLPEIPPATAAGLGEALRGMIAACLVHDAWPRRVAPEDMARRKRAEAERVIRRELASVRLDAERIARLVKVSRSTLYRLFEPDGGVAGYVQRLRLAHARAALSDPTSQGTPIGLLVERSGFHCAASFTRAFHREYGETPSAFRRRAGNKAASPQAGFAAILHAE